MKDMVLGLTNELISAIVSIRKPHWRVVGKDLTDWRVKVVVRYTQLLALVLVFLDPFNLILFDVGSVTCK